MSYITAWTRGGGPHQIEFQTEAAAEAHARELVRLGTASHAVVWEFPPTKPAQPAEEIAVPITAETLPDERVTK